MLKSSRHSSNTPGTYLVDMMALASKLYMASRMLPHMSKLTQMQILRTIA